MEAINSALSKIKYKKGQKLSDYLLTRTEMNRIKHINKFLTTIDIFSTTLGGAKFVTSSIVFPVVASMKKLLKADSDDPVYIAKMKEIILEDFKPRLIENLNFELLLKATALDPRFKLMKMVEDKEGREKVFDKIEEELNALSQKKTVTTKKDENVVKVKKQKLCLDFDESDEEDEQNENSVKRELAAYRSETVLGRDEDPLLWWRSRKEQYPLLIHLVRYVIMYYKVRLYTAM